MKKINFGNLFGFALFCLAIIFGAGAGIAMADVAQPITPSPDTESLDTQLGGHPASATTISDSEINDKEIENFMVKFRPYLFPTSSDIFKNARKLNVTDMIVYHPASGTSELDFTTHVAKNQTDTSITLDIATDNLTVDELRILSEYSTILVNGVKGYKPYESGVQQEENGWLMLKVTQRQSNSVTLIPINGIYNTGTSKYAVPAIPAGTKLSAMGNAATESQLECSPENFEPILKETYLQKQLANIVITDDFKNKKKNVNFYEDDLKDDALYKFRRKFERTLWFGQKGKRREFVSNNMGYEDAYFTEGIMWQIQNKYAIDSDGLTFADLHSINRMQHTKNALGKESWAYCGSGFIEMLLNLNKDLQSSPFFSQTENEYGIEVYKFRDNFGVINFEYCPILDEMGYQNCAAIIDVRNSTQYNKVFDKQTHVDMKQGGGTDGAREASRDIFVRTTGFTLHGTNSILVGYTSDIYGMTTVNPIDTTNIHTFTYEDATPLNLNPDTTAAGSFFGASGAPVLVDGDLYYVAKYDSYTHSAAGEILQYDSSATGTAVWTKYSGVITAG